MKKRTDSRIRVERKIVYEAGMTSESEMGKKTIYHDFASHEKESDSCSKLELKATNIVNVASEACECMTCGAQVEPEHDLEPHIIHNRTVGRCLAPSRTHPHALNICYSDIPK